MVCLLVAFFSQANAQDMDSFALARSRFFQAGYYHFNGQGRLQVGFIQSNQNTNAVFFDDEAIRKEIELVQTQKAPYDSVIKQWNKDFEQLQKKIADGFRDKSLTAEDIPQLRTQCDQRAINKLRDILLPHQFAVVDEIQYRSLFRTHGLNFLLASEKLCEQLSIDENESNALKSQYKQSIRTITSETQKIKNEIIVDILQPLTEPQQAEFFKKWEHLAPDSTHTSVEELLAYLDPDLIKWANRTQPPLKKLLSRPNYQTGPAGNLILQEQSKYFDEDLTIITMFFGRPYSFDIPGISDEDVKVVKRLLMKPYQMVESDGKTAQASPNNIDDEELKQAVVEIKQYLGKDGWKNVEKHANLINIKSAGPIFDLTEGDLCELLGLTDRQIERIEANVKKAREKLVKKTNEVETKILDQIIAVADAESQTKLKKLFGKPLKYTPANLGLISMTSMMEY